MGDVKQYWLIVGSEDTGEIVEEADLLESVHDLFCCDEDLESCDNGYFSDFKKSKEDGDKMWSGNFEDGWIQIQKLAALPKPFLALQQVNAQLRQQIERLSRPVSDEEWNMAEYEYYYARRSDIDALIAARAGKQGDNNG